jgi:NACalpha-BTF3-like transcription factor
VTPEKVTFVADNGCTEDEARDALEAAQGDVEKAILSLGKKEVNILRH